MRLNMAFHLTAERSKKMDANYVCLSSVVECSARLNDLHVLYWRRGQQVGGFAMFEGLFRVMRCLQVHVDTHWFYNPLGLISEIKSLLISLVILQI